MSKVHPNEALGLYKGIQDAEKRLSDELFLQEKILRRISNVQCKTKNNAREALEDSPEQQAAREHIEVLKVRLELLRNIRMNWEPFTKNAKKRGIDIRINQFTAIKQLIQFLETGKGEPLPGDVERTFTPANTLSTYTVQPTGAGKTGAFAIETALLSTTTLVLVPFDNLLEQTREDMIKVGGIDEHEIGLVGGGDKQIGKRITIATYAGHAALLRSNPEYASFLHEQCKFVICDEVHMALGDYTQAAIGGIDGIENDQVNDAEATSLHAEEDVLIHMREQVSARALKQGFTATDRLSNKHVAQYFPHYLGRVYHADMIDAGILVPYSIVQSDGLIVEGDIITDSMTQEKEVEILRRENVYKNLLGKYQEALHRYNAHRNQSDYPLRAMAFCTNHSECEVFAEEAKKTGIRCTIITGREAKGKKGRELIVSTMQDVIAGNTDIIVTVEKLCAGFNFPEINAILWARVTSMAKTIQGIGRGARSFEQNGYAKDRCWVFEVNWAMDVNRKKGKLPMRIADALAEHGEDPDKICSMANGTSLDVRTELTAEDVTAWIKEKSTPEQWATMKYSDKKALRINGRVYGMAIATLLGIAGGQNPVSCSSAHLAIGRAVWGDDADAIEKAEKLKLTKEEIIIWIKDNFTPESWSIMMAKEKKALRINRRVYGLAVATFLGLKGDPSSNHSIHLAVGRAVWGEDIVALQATEKPELVELTKQDVTDWIKENYTAEEWAKMKKSDKQALRINGRVYGRAIATLLGVKGDPSHNHLFHLAIGKAMWIQSSEILSEQTTDATLAWIKKNTTPEKWAIMSCKERQALRINGRVYGQAIARLLGVEGHPVGTSSIHLAVGRAVWGEDIVALQATEKPELVELTKQDVINWIKENYTAEEWAKMKRSDKQALRINGRVYGRAVATLLGVKGNPVKDSFSIHLAIGRAVWGDLPILQD